MAVGTGALDQESLGGGDKGFAGERAADDVDESIGQVRAVAESFVFDLPTDANGAAEQVGGIGFALAVVSGGGYVDSAVSGINKDIIAQK